MGRASGLRVQGGRGSGYRRGIPGFHSCYISFRRWGGGGAGSWEEGLDFGLHPVEECSYSVAGGAFAVVGEVFVGFGGAGDVEVGPGGGIGGGEGEGDESGAGEGGGVAAGGVDDVGEVGFEHVAVLVVDGESPEFFAGVGGGGGEFGCEGVGVGEEAGHGGSECDDTAAGERGEVDDGGGFMGGDSVGDCVGEDETAFGVGVGDFDGDAVVEGEDVAGAVGG